MDFALETFETVALWLTVGLAAAAIIAGVILYFIKRPVAGRYARIALLSFVGYVLAVGVTLLGLQLAVRLDPAYLERNGLAGDVVWYVNVPLIVLFSFALVGGTGIYLAYKFRPSIYKGLRTAYIVLLVCGLVAAGVTIGVYYYRDIYGDGYYNSEEAGVNQTALYVAAAVLAAVAIGGALFLGRKDKAPWDGRCLALAGICIAMSFVLSYVRLFKMPQGGSVTLASMLPLMIYAYMYGPKKGVFAGFVYGLLEALQDPFIIHPAQFILDYPLAFAMIGFAGVFASLNIKHEQTKFALGAIFAVLLRYLCHVLSGVFAFGVYAMEANYSSSLVYSLAYNSVVLVDLAIALVAGVILFSSKAFVRQMKKYAAPAPARPLPEPDPQGAEAETKGEEGEK